jgi:hypothetical protein
VKRLEMMRELYPEFDWALTGAKVREFVDYYRTWHEDGTRCREERVSLMCGPGVVLPVCREPGCGRPVIWVSEVPLRLDLRAKEPTS